MRPPPSRSWTFERALPLPQVACMQLDFVFIQAPQSCSEIKKQHTKHETKNGTSSSEYFSDSMLMYRIDQKKVAWMTGREKEEEKRTATDLIVIGIGSNKRIAQHFCDGLEKLFIPAILDFSRNCILK
jgi:hypothetical protein